MAATIYLEILSDVNDGRVQVTTETYVTLFVFRFIRCDSNISICLIRSHQPANNLTSIPIDISSMQFSVKNFNDPEFRNDEAALLKLPVLVNDKCVIAGLCGVCRGLLKLVNNNETSKLLGFKEGCLQAPSETSTWTKFCEVDFINCTKNIVKLNAKHFDGTESFELFDEFGIFEKHLSLPVRMHNVYKVARDLAKEKKAQPDVEVVQQLEKLSVEGREKTPRLNKQRKSKVSSRLFFVSVIGKSAQAFDRIIFDRKKFRLFTGVKEFNRNIEQHPY